jgi:ribosome biogenesis GTPase
MRELGIAEVESGLASAFADVEALASNCRFNDCAHEAEPGCAVLNAIESGKLDERRLDSYRKLKREELHNTETVAERHNRARQFSKSVKQNSDRRSDR